MVFVSFFSMAGTWAVPRGVTECMDSSSCFWLFSARLRERRRRQRINNHVQIPTASNDTTVIMTMNPTLITPNFVDGDATEFAVEVADFVDEASDFVG